MKTYTVLDFFLNAQDRRFSVSNKKPEAEHPASAFFLKASEIYLIASTIAFNVEIRGPYLTWRLSLRLFQRWFGDAPRSECLR